jgi:hypothetical protein
LKFHVGDQEGYFWADWQATILHIGHPSIIAQVETTVELTQLASA